MGVTSITSPTFLNYAKRIGRVYMHSTFGTGADEFMTSLNKSIFSARPKNAPWYNPYKGAKFDDFWTKFKNAFKEVEKHEAAVRKANGNSYIKSFWKQITSIPKTFADEWKLGGEVAKRAKKSVLWGKIGGANKALMKRMPLIGGLMALGFQIPNVINAFTSKDGGVATGLLETGKAVAKIGLDTAGFMIGQALIPIPLVGGLIGSFAASFLGEKILGKSFSQKQEEAAGQQQILPTWTPYIAQGSGIPNFSGSSGFVPPQSAYSAEQLMNMKQYLDRDICWG